MNASEFIRLYPKFNISSDNRIIPYITLPRDFKERVAQFYENQGKQKIEDLAKKIRDKDEHPIQLQWHAKLGLTNINLGCHFGLDLDEKTAEFLEHNLDGRFSLEAATIAQRYIIELLRIKK